MDDPVVCQSEETVKRYGDCPLTVLEDRLVSQETLGDAWSRGSSGLQVVLKATLYAPRVSVVVGSGPTSGRSSGSTTRNTRSAYVSFADNSRQPYGLAYSDVRTPSIQKQLDRQTDMYTQESRER